MRTKNERSFLFEKVTSLLSKGYSQRAIASETHLSIGKINQVVQQLRARARDNWVRYVDRTLPEEMELSLVRLDNIMKELHKDLDNNKEQSKRDRYNAIALINQCTQLKLEILEAGVLANQLNNSSSSNNSNNTTTTVNKNETDTVS